MSLIISYFCADLFPVDIKDIKDIKVTKGYKGYKGNQRSNIRGGQKSVFSSFLADFSARLVRSILLIKGQII